MQRPNDYANTQKPLSGGAGRLQSFMAKNCRRVLAIDVETTGLISAYDYITEIGMAVMEGGEVVGTPLLIGVKPDMDKMKVSVGAAKVQCGTLDKFVAWIQDLETREAPLEAAKKVSQWCYDNNVSEIPNIAYNAVFDWSFFASKILSYRSLFKGPSPLSPVWIDVCDMARRTVHDLPDAKLDTVLPALGLPTRKDSHNALQDAILCGRVYHELLEKQ